MTSPHPATEAWAHWWNELDALAAFLKRVKGSLVSSAPTRDQAKAAVQYYFRVVRPELIALRVNAARVEQLDWITQYLLKLAAKTSRKSTYRNRMHELTGLRHEVE